MNSIRGGGDYRRERGQFFFFIYIKNDTTVFTRKKTKIIIIQFFSRSLRDRRRRLSVIDARYWRRMILRARLPQRTPPSRRRRGPFKRDRRAPTAVIFEIVVFFSSVKHIIVIAHPRGIFAACVLECARCVSRFAQRAAYRAAIGFSDP